jgi:hypothetical protein
MEAKDLRIGNLVYIGGQINEIELVDFVDIYENYTIGIYKPIPLTEEWLLKFGFKSDDISWEYSKRLGNFYIMYDIEINSIYINDGSRYDGADIPKEIKHVHQLQNLYFALTGQELTLNN